jgi:hypothetical protein
MRDVVKLSLKERNAVFRRDTSDCDALQIMIDDTIHGCTEPVSTPYTIPTLQLISITIMFFDRGCYFRLGPLFVSSPSATSILKQIDRAVALLRY